jgi:hypothetical protein
LAIAIFRPDRGIYDLLKILDSLIKSWNEVSFRAYAV